MNQRQTLNPWVAPVSKRAERLFEDSDRVSFAAPKFLALIGTVAARITAMATRAPEPLVKRDEFDGTVRLMLVWEDKPSGWWLHFSVVRGRGEKPRVELDFCGADVAYAQGKPSQQDVDRALYDYFEAWRERVREGGSGMSRMSRTRATE